MEDQELKKYIKDLRDIAIKREVEGNGPNRWWYLSEYSELYWEKAPAAVFLLLVVGGVIAYNNPVEALEVVKNWLLLLGLLFGAIFSLVALPILAFRLISFVFRVIMMILNSSLYPLQKFWDWLTRVN